MFTIFLLVYFLNINHSLLWQAMVIIFRVKFEKQLKKVEIVGNMSLFLLLLIYFIFTFHQMYFK